MWKRCAPRASARVHAPALPAGLDDRAFIAPTLIEIDSADDLDREVFGPVLHVLRYRREAIDDLIDRINAKGFGLTFGLHSRIDETIAHVGERIAAGNIYVNRNMIGAVVGVQPFGGHGLSGIGPKAGGPLYLRRLLSAPPPPALPGKAPPVAAVFHEWLAAQGHAAEAARASLFIERTPLGYVAELPGPVGERNLYLLEPRGTIGCIASTPGALLVQIAAALAAGNRIILPTRSLLPDLPPEVESMVTRDGTASAYLFEGSESDLRALAERLAEGEGPIQPVHVATDGDYPLEFLVREKCVSTNTAAAGGNASLMSIG
jgi:RHH-type proline utilization regulon transcriptional repressor/proline dehydrogenase/delta 1-pyrroline-5-carboxylate dehydrogenase